MMLRSSLPVLLTAALGLLALGALSVGPSTSSSVSTVGLVPVGGIVPWLKSFTNTPALSGGVFGDANGQVLNDPASVNHGKTLPNLNNGTFLRGNTTSGDTGGSGSHAHTLDLSGTSAGDPGTSGGSTVPWGTYATDTREHFHRSVMRCG